jgi:alpha-ribazole phosphatase
MAELWCWRHPRATNAAGRCIGRTDLPVDPRKAKRLAHHIRAAARRHGLPRVLWVSTLQRSAGVGPWLRRWGWQVHADARLCELDFGAWDGRPWADIAWAEVEAWQADLLHHAPGGGESLAALARRVASFTAEVPAGNTAVQLVTHGGWINALCHLPPGAVALQAADWPAPPKHGSLTRWAGLLQAAA